MLQQCSDLVLAGSPWHCSSRDQDVTSEWGDHVTLAQTCSRNAALRQEVRKELQ